MTRKNRSLLKEEMQYHLTSWQQSEQSQKEYCQANNLPLYKFHYWIHKLRGSHNPLADSFVPVNMQPSSSPVSASDLEIAYPNGVRLKVPSGDVHLIGQLIRLI
jgi:hypothetical protein